MLDTLEFIQVLEQLKSQLRHGELETVDIDHFIRKYQSQVDEFEADLFDNLPV